MRNFKIGDEVIALTNPPTDRCQHRVKGNSYIVKEVVFCPTNGHQAIHIGGRTYSDSGYYNCKCGKKHENYNLGLTTSEAFIHKDDLEEKFEDAIENEDYETAQLLKEFIV